MPPTEALLAAVLRGEPVAWPPEASHLEQPPLRFLHSEAILSQVKLDRFRTMVTAELIESLRPGRSGALRTRADGTVLEGHHRLAVLRERSVDIDGLPREVLPQEPEG